MRSALRSLIPCLSAAALAACAGEEPAKPIARDAGTITPGAPLVGMSEGVLDYPVGSAMGGYTGRCTCFGGDGEIDDRRTAYTNRFNPSVGIQTRPRVVAMWLHNGQEDLVLIKVDAIYVYDGFITELERRLSAATGKDLDGRVVLAANHSHSAPASWSKGLTWYLGGDAYNEEIFQRVAASMEAQALAAHAALAPAAIGMAQATDWDGEDRVYSDRRPENDTLAFFDGIPAGTYKDPYLTLLRVDHADGRPMGFWFAFGIHGTTLGGDNQLWSVEAPGHVELAVQERFDSPIVVGHLQHGGGDASPRGADVGQDFARMESVGELAADAIVGLWERTPTSSAPIRLETITHAVPTLRDEMSVSRPHGELVYAPVDPSATADGVVWNPDGTLATPIDEFNTAFGGAFCGDDTPLLPGTGIGSEVFPYNSCVAVDVIAGVIGTFFSVPPEDVVLPLPESLKAQATASRVGPLSILTPEGETVEDDVLLAFFPGETTAMFTEQFRRRAAEELGYRFAVPFGYAQDHEGYLMIPEDWLMGGYEPNINLWGPLHGEHILEHVLGMAGTWLETDAREPQDPLGLYAPTAVPAVPLLPNAPDDTPAAGTLAAAAPEYLYVPVEGLTVEVGPPASVRRVQDIVQLVWEGGDPAVDTPTVTLEREDDNGAWVEVTSASGRPVTDAFPDILLATTPDPLYPFDVPQSHVWWAGWQVVPHDGDRTALPLGTYRLRVDGHSYAGGAEVWPWPADPYTVTSEPFTVEPATLSVGWADGVATVSLPAHPAGFRLVDVDGRARGANPVREVFPSWELDDGTLAPFDPGALTVADGTTRFAAVPPAGAVALHVEDAHGNGGALSL